MAHTPLLSLSCVEKSYIMNNTWVPVLNGIDLKVESGEFVVIQGEVGSGKSALLNILSGIERCSHGSMKLAGLPMMGAEEDQELVNSFVTFLSPVFSIDVRQTIRQAVNQPGLKTRVAPELCLELAGIAQNDNRRIEELDHGMRRRVGIARALLSRPKILLAEMSPPPWGVAPPLDVLLDANEELGCAVIATTEKDLRVAGSRKLSMIAGRIAKPSLVA